MDIPAWRGFLSVAEKDRINWVSH